MKASFHTRNRRTLIDSMDKCSVLYLQSRDPTTKGDSEYLDFPEVNLFYLTGIVQPHTSLLIYKDSRGNSREHLFISENGEHLERWVGARISPAQARKISGIRDIQINDSFDKVSQRFFGWANKLYYLEDLWAENPGKSSYRLNWEKASRKYKLQKENVFDQLSIQRNIKSSEEIEMMRIAMKTTRESFLEIMSNMSSFKSEADIHAELIKTYIKNGCTPAYNPIVGSGNNGWILHYIKNDEPLKKGDLVLIDAGAEYKNYDTDITRTLPISGKFTKRQAQVYEAVLKVQKAAIKAMKPGVNIREWDALNRELMGEELVKLGLLTQKEVDKEIANSHKSLEKDNYEFGRARYFPKINSFYPHGLSHSLGLDTHDPAPFGKDNVFKPGMVYTVEPGIYIDKERINIRIEDDVLITKSGRDVLSKKIPKEIKEIEELCK